MENSNGRYKKVETIYIDSIGSGMVQPQATSLEDAILGACMYDPGNETYETAAAIVKPEMFYKPQSILIFRSFARLYNAYSPIDELTVTHDLNKVSELENIGGPYYLTQLKSKVTTTANVDAHCRIIYQMFIKRETIRVCADKMNKAYKSEIDAFELVDELKEEVNNIGEDAQDNDFITMEQGMDAFDKEIARKEKIEGDIIGIQTGFTEIDKCTGGIQPGDLITIGAGTGSGKTTLSLNIAENAAKKGNPIAVFMLEVPKEHGIAKIVTSYTSSNYKAVRRGRLGEKDKGTIKHDSYDIKRLPIFINDKSGINYLQVRSSLKRLMRVRAKERLGNGLDPHEAWLGIIDYVQLMGVPANSRARSREQELSETTKNLKAIAKDLGIGIILLAQVNKNVKGRKGNRLVLGDIRDSAGVEMDSDIVIFIYEPDETIDKMARIAEIAKHRNGELLTTRLRVEFWRQKFMNPDEKEPTPIKFEKKNEQFDEGFNADSQPFT